MRKILFIPLVCLALTFASCGTTYETNPAKYGKWDTSLDIPSFLPKSIAEYEVNEYSYTLYSYMDVCYEIFVDITVTETQFNELITNAKNNDAYLHEKQAYYNEGYTEIVFQDVYTIYTGEHINPATNVGWADIEKVIYNKKTLNVIYVCFHANDTGVYELSDVAYFNRFSIQQTEYVEMLNL